MNRVLEHVVKLTLKLTTLMSGVQCDQKKIAKCL